MRATACRCPHAPYNARLHAVAEAAFGRRAFLTGAAASFAALFVPRRVFAEAGTATMAPDGVTVLRAARMFDGVRMHAPGVLVVRGDRIASLSSGDAGSGATTIDLGDATLLPGLIDAHTHVAANVVSSTYLTAFGPKNEAASSVAEAALLSIANAQSMLANGFTTIRDVGGGAGIDLAMRDAIARGAVRGPRILAAGTALSITGGHGDQNDLPPWIHVDDEERPGTAYGPYGFREQVRAHVKRHVDLIKITATGGVLSYGDTFDVPQLNLDEIQAVVDEAGKFGRKVSAHCHGIAASRSPSRADVTRSSMPRASEAPRCMPCNSARPISCRRFGHSIRSCSRAIPITSPPIASTRRIALRSCATKACNARSR